MCLSYFHVYILSKLLENVLEEKNGWLKERVIKIRYNRKEHLIDIFLGSGRYLEKGEETRGSVSLQHNQRQHLLDREENRKDFKSSIYNCFGLEFAFLFSLSLDVSIDQFLKMTKCSAGPGLKERPRHLTGQS